MPGLCTLPPWLEHLEYPEEERQVVVGRINGYRFRVEWSDEDEVYVVRAPDLEGCVTHGGTLEEAVKHIEEAIESWLDVASQHGDPIPEKIADEN